MKIKVGEAIMFPKFRCPQCNLPVRLEDAVKTPKERLRCPKCNSYLEQIMEPSDDLRN